MSAKTQALGSAKTFSTRTLATTAMLIALMVLMMFTPIGRIQLPIVSVTIAHIPILIAVFVLGLYPGLIVAFAFGATSLIIALTAPATLLDPFFVNPLISILPRMLIPLTTFVSYRGLSKLFGTKGDVATIAISAAIGNLTNTFGVYTMLYLVYAKSILEQTGSSAITLIVTAISTSTLLKCAVVMLLTTPLVMGLKRALKFT